MHSGPCEGPVNAGTSGRRSTENADILCHGDLVRQPGILAVDALPRFKCSSSSGLGPLLVLLSPFVVRPDFPPRYNARIFPRAAARVLTILNIPSSRPLQCVRDYRRKDRIVDHCSAGR
jgi:hypothetical protein